MREETRKICEIVRSCGEIIKNVDRNSIKIDAKEGYANFVTEYDKKVEDKLKEGLLTVIPDARFVGEEGDEKYYEPEGTCFVVDPIDGTTNFIKDYKMSCISVAVVTDGKPEIGVVYNPYLNEMYWAERGQGAYLNDERIRVSDQPLSNGVVLFGTAPYYEELHERSFEMVYKYFKQALDVRRSGSAALDLCAIAAGRAELFFELRLCPWDFAAGALLVEEAGGIITDEDGNPVKYNGPSSVIARNK